jgi:hypothetical protein
LATASGSTNSFLRKGRPVRFTVPAWTVESYAHDRRSHRHRCKCCHRIIQDGDAAFVARVKAHKSIAVHAECASTPVMPGRSETYRDTLREAAFQYQLAAFGYCETNPKHYAKIAELRAYVGAPINR